MAQEMRYFSTRGGKETLSFEDVSAVPLRAIQTPAHTRSGRLDRSRSQRRVSNISSVASPLADTHTVSTSPPTSLPFPRTGIPSGPVFLSQSSPTKSSLFSSPPLSFPPTTSSQSSTLPTAPSDPPPLRPSGRLVTRNTFSSFGMAPHGLLRTWPFSSWESCSGTFWRGGTRTRLRIWKN